MSYEELEKLLGEPLAGAGAVEDGFNSRSSYTDDFDFSWLVNGLQDDEDEGDDGEEDTSESESEPDQAFVRATPSPIGTGIGYTPSTTPVNFTSSTIQSHQEQLHQDMDGSLIDAALEENKRARTALKEMLDRVTEDQQGVYLLKETCRGLEGRTPGGYSKEVKELMRNPFAVVLKHADRLRLPVNVVKAYEGLAKEHQAAVKSSKWTRLQREQLLKGVRQQCQKALMSQILANGDNASGYNTSGYNASGYNAIQTKIAAIKQMSDAELFQHVGFAELDFNKISSLFVPSKSAMDCQIQWMNVDRPGINKSSEWTEEELRKLDELRKARRKVDWKKFAADLGTNRTAFDCACQFRRLYQPHINTGRWTEEEDNVLKKAVATAGVLDWIGVAAMVPRRTPNQCSHRWKKVLSPSIRAGRWTPEEDDLLRAAVEKHPNAWNLIAKLVPGRTDVKCRERWVNNLDPTVLKTQFTLEEDNTLRAAVGELGTKWSLVAQRLVGRTDSQCRRRWQQMKKKLEDSIADLCEDVYSGGECTSDAAAVSHDNNKNSKTLKNSKKRGRPPGKKRKNTKR